MVTKVMAWKNAEGTGKPDYENNCMDSAYLAEFERLRVAGYKRVTVVFE